jgi:hypothetical protein
MTSANPAGAAPGHYHSRVIHAVNGLLALASERAVPLSLTQEPLQKSQTAQPSQLSPPSFCDGAIPFSSPMTLCMPPLFGGLPMFQDGQCSALSPSILISIEWGTHRKGVPIARERIRKLVKLELERA